MLVTAAAVNGAHSFILQRQINSSTEEDCHHPEKHNHVPVTSSFSDFSSLRLLQLCVTNIPTGHNSERSEKLLYCQMNEAVGIDECPVLTSDLHLMARHKNTFFIQRVMLLNYFAWNTNGNLLNFVHWENPKKKHTHQNPASFNNYPCPLVWNPAASQTQWRTFSHTVRSCLTWVRSPVLIENFKTPWEMSSSMKRIWLLSTPFQASWLSSHSSDRYWLRSHTVLHKQTEDKLIHVPLQNDCNLVLCVLCQWCEMAFTSLEGSWYLACLFFLFFQGHDSETHQEQWGRPG